MLFWHVILPLTRNGTITGCIIVFTATISEFIVPELLGGADVVTIGRVLWLEFFSNIDWPMACCLSIVIVMLIMVATSVMNKFGDNKKTEKHI